MGPSKRTIPYVSVNGSRDKPFTEDLQLASLYVIAEARRGTELLTSIAHVYYPLQFRRSRRGVLLIDMLGLNQTTFNLNLIPDIEGFTKGLDEASKDPDTFLKELRGKANYFKTFSGQNKVVIRGLISNSRKIDEIESLLKKSVELKKSASPRVFDPILNSKDIKAIFTSLNSIRKDVKRDQKRLEEAKKSLMAALDTAKKALKEDITKIKENSAGVKAKLKRGLMKKRDSLKKGLKRDNEKIRETYREKAKPLQDERRRRRRRFKRLEKKIEKLNLEGNYGAVESLQPNFNEARDRFMEMDDALNKLLESRGTEIQEAKDRYNAALKIEKDKIKAEGRRAKAKVQERLDLESQLVDEAKGIAGHIDALIRKKRYRLRYLSTKYLDLATGNTELRIPFYIFQYGKRSFDLYPPAVVAGSSGLFSRFRRMLADNVETKLNMLIRPQGAFTERYLVKAVSWLGGNTALARAYQQRVDDLNLFRSLTALDGMMRGLVKMRRERWISDSEYIRLQEDLVDRLSMIPRP